MPGPFASGFLPLLAQAAAPNAAPAANDAPSMLPMIVITLGMFLLWQVLIGGPQRSQEKKRRAMIAALKKNDRVLTAAGIYGTVVSADPSSDRVTLRVDDDKGVKIDVSRGSIAQVLDLESGKDKAASTAAR